MAKVSAYDSYFRVNKASGSVTVVRVRRGEPAPTGPQYEVWPAPRMSDAKKREVLKGLRAEAKTVANGWVIETLPLGLWTCGACLSLLKTNSSSEKGLVPAKRYLSAGNYRKGCHQGSEFPLA